MIDKFHFYLTSMLSIGRISYMPGTIASAITCIVFFCFIKFDPIFFITYKIIIFIILTLLFLTSFYSIERITRFAHHKDSREIVIDEFFGQLIPLLFFYYYIFSEFADRFQLVMSLDFYILGSFIFFRFFDIVKPFPIGLIDKKFNSSLGVMLDDIIAGIFTTIILFIPSLIF